MIHAYQYYYTYIKLIYFKMKSLMAIMLSGPHMYAHYKSGEN